MRVKSSGGRGGAGGFGSDPKRAAAFRRSHQVGQKVSGRFLGWERGNLAWVNIDGQPLLARLEADPAVGGRLAFQVASLYPEVVLRQLDQAGGATGAGPTLAQAGRELAGLKGSFGEMLAGLDLPGGVSGGGRGGVSRREFFQALERDPEALGRYVEVLESQAMVNALLSPSGNVRYLYMPWLFPEGGGVEMLLKTLVRDVLKDGEDGEPGPPLQELVFGFNLSRLGPGQARIVFIDPRAGYKVQLERAEHVGALGDFLEGFDFPGSFPGLGAEMVCRGVEKLPNYARSGIMGELLSPRATLISGVNIRV